MLNKRLFFSVIMLFSVVTISLAQALPACSDRPFVAEFPRINPIYWCIELPVVAEAEATQTYTALHFSADGTFYATHPYRGEVVTLIDSNADGLPDSETVVADGLRFPNGLADHEGVLYIMGDGIVYTLRDDTVEVLVDNLPNGRGFLARAIVIHDEFIYIGMPSPCDFCVGDDPLHGTVLRMALDGTEQTVIASGLRYPSALAVYQDALWVTDIARDGFSADVFYDEVNRIDLANTDSPHFGFPYCVGYENIPDLESEFDCGTATAPTITFRSNSTPIALHHYTDTLFSEVTDRLMIVLLGDNSSRYIAGHAIISVEISETGHLYENIAPVDDATNSFPSRWTQADGQRVDPQQTEFVNNQAGGIFPYLPYDIVTSPEGWLYFSVENRGIFVLRPKQ